MSELHGRDALAAFQNGETRLVYARYRDNPGAPAFYLEDGAATAPSMREFVRDRLECFMPECRDRRLQLVNRHKGVRPKRDGFRHMSGAGGHSPESLFHQQAKALVREWAARQAPEATVLVEEPLADRERVADVLATWPTGERVAFEIQYSALSIVDWQRRHESYIANGITPVWLYGHIRPHLRVNTAAHTAAFSGLHRTMRSLGAQVLWLNPIERLVATPSIEQAIDGVEGQWRTRPTIDDDRVGLSIDPLDACRLDPRLGLLTPTMLGIEVSEASHERRLREAQEEARGAAERAAAERAKRIADLAVRALDTASTPVHAAGGCNGTDILVGPAEFGPDENGLFTRCVCGLRLDPSLWRAGLHFGCEPLLEREPYRSWARGTDYPTDYSN